MTIECRLALVGILVFAGCASAPKQPAGSAAVPAASTSASTPESGGATAFAAAPEPGAATAFAAAPESAAAPATASASTGSAGGTAAPAATGAAPTVEVAKLADTNPVTCRDMLVQGSNQMRRRCMTRNDWKVFDQAQRIWAQDLLLRMQGLKR
jgi:hypothetical protein